MTNAATTSRNWQRPDPVDAESEWEVFLTSKKQAMNRMKSGRVDALRRLGSEKPEGRSVVSELSDDREAAGSFNKGHYSTSGRSELRDAPESIRENPALDSQSRSDLDMRKLIELFTVIKKRKWNDLVELIQMYPRSASIPCPKNIQSTAKGNLMLHEACRNNPPLEVISALVDEYADAVKAKGGKGYLPLHYACATDASTDVVQKLLDTFPASIRMRDTNDLMIPLHFACKWGASPAIIDILASAYPEGKQVRDIYAKTPVEYANELRGPHRGATLKTLERSYHSRTNRTHSERSFSRSVAASDASLSDAVSVASKQIHRELKSTKVKLDKATSELSQREMKFTLQYGAEQSKASELEKQKDMLEQECAEARLVQEEQKEKIHLLREEVVTLKSLREIHNQKRVMLMEKIEELEQEKVSFGDKNHESSATMRRELTATMVEQEIKYKAMLAGEQRKIDNLEKKSQEAELTHRHYTMALLQEHEKEVSRFEELTSRFKVLEGQLRHEIDNERKQRITAQSASHGSSQHALESEKEKVAFLEAHITKVNDLLEAEQKRFIELEAILKETLAIENEQREEIEAEFREKESQYQSRIEIEGQKRSQLEKAYTDIAEKLKEEIEKTSGLQAYESELKKELKMDQEKIAELQRLQEKSERTLEKERQRVKDMAEKETNTRLLLKTEELKVRDLEKNLDIMRSLLKNERESVKALRTELEGLQALYGKEIKKVKEAEESESSARFELRSLHEKVANLEKEESVIKTKISIANSTKNECQKLKSVLASERDQVDRLAQSEEDVLKLLNAEKEKVKSLQESQIVDEAEMDEMNSQSSFQSTVEERLMEKQATLDHHKYRVTALEGKHDLLTKELETERSATKRLELTVEQKEEQLEEEREKFEVLLTEHGAIQAQLALERNKVQEIEGTADKFGQQLRFEKGSMQEMQRMVDQAKIDFQSKIEEVASLEQEEEDSRHALNTSLKEMNVTNEEATRLAQALIVEKGRVAEMAAALKEVQNLVQDEKNRVIELKRLLEAQQHLSLADKEKMIQLEQIIEEQLEDLGLGKAENSKLETDLEETKILLDAEAQKVMELLENGHQFDSSRASELYETEQNKVKALEHSCEQLMSLLDFEKKHVQSLEEKQEELQEQAESSTDDLASTKKELEESQKKVLKLAYELDGFEDMKKELIRLTLVARQRDIMMAAMLHAIGDAKAIKGKAPIRNAEMHLNDLESRVIGLDLAGFDESVFQDREASQLVTYDASLRKRTIRNVVLPLILAGGLVEYHHHDPTVLRELAVTAVQMSGDLRSNLGEYSHTLGDLSKSVGANFAANMGQLAAAISESSVIRETVAQVGGMATRRANFRQV